MDQDELKDMYKHAFAYQLYYSRFDGEYDSQGTQHYGDIQQVTFDIQRILRTEVDDWGEVKNELQSEVLEEVEN